MWRLVRTALIAVAAGVCLAGPIAAAAVALSPPSWRTPAAVWVILLGSVVFVARLQRRR